MMKRLIFAGIAGALLFGAHQAGANPYDRHSRATPVKVVNLPEVQEVDGTVEVGNFPQVQNVEVDNFPDVQQVEVVAGERERVRIVGLDSFSSPDQVAATIYRASENYEVPLDSVPNDKKLIITDVQVRSKTTFNTWHCAALRGADDCSEGSTEGRRHSVCVQPNYAAPDPVNANAAYDYFKTVSLTTGLEFSPGQDVCLGASGGGNTDDSDFIRIDALGYLISP